LFLLNSVRDMELPEAVTVIGRVEFPDRENNCFLKK